MTGLFLLREQSDETMHGCSAAWNSAPERAQHKGPDGEDWGVFRKRGGKIRHFWGLEMAFAPPALRQHHRAGDLADPLWNLLDMTPEGRGGEWFPKVEY